MDVLSRGNSGIRMWAQIILFCHNPLVYRRTDGQTDKQICRVRRITFSRTVKIIWQTASDYKTVLSDVKLNNLSRLPGAPERSEPMVVWRHGIDNVT